MIPNKKQWKQWSLPSRHTTIGLLVGIISVFVGFASFFISSDRGSEAIDLKLEVKEAYNEIQTESKREDQYIKRYLKDRIADIDNVEILETNNNPVARIYYYSYWTKLTSLFRASVEIRVISDLNSKYMEDEGWKKAILIDGDGDYEHTTSLVESEFVDVSNVSKGEIYEVRMVDFNYDSDEPPTAPYRFQVP